MESHRDTYEPPYAYQEDETPDNKQPLRITVFPVHVPRSAQRARISYGNSLNQVHLNYLTVMLRPRSCFLWPKHLNRRRFRPFRRKERAFRVTACQAIYVNMNSVIQPPQPCSTRECRQRGAPHSFIRCLHSLIVVASACANADINARAALCIMLIDVASQSVV